MSSNTTPTTGKHVGPGIEESPCGQLSQERFATVWSQLPQMGHHTRQLFTAAGVDAYYRHHALRVGRDLREDGSFGEHEAVTYVLPGNTPNGVTAFVQSKGDYTVVPAEVPLTAISPDAATPISLAETPAWVLRPPVSVDVTWHARVRWAERISPSTDPSSDIVEAMQRGIRVATPDGRANYDPLTGALLIYDPDQGGTVITVQHVVDPTDDERITAVRAKLFRAGEGDTECETVEATHGLLERVNRVVGWLRR